MAADKKKRELMKLLNKLGKIRGSGTELISLYVPAGYPLTEVVNKLRSEHGQAGNIKSKTTRTNVQDAIDKIINYLKFFRKTPDKGLAIFCGNISKDPGKTDIQLFSIEPPLPIQVSIYRCDSEFILEPLAEQGKVKEKYGLITIDGKEATIGVLEGNVTKILKRLTTTGPSKSTKGGSCIREDGMVQLENGMIIPISQVREGDRVLSYDFTQQRYKFSTCNRVMKRKTNIAYKIITKHPRTEIIATPEHLFFVKETENSIREKYVDELKVGDRLIHISNFEIKGKETELPLEIKEVYKLDSKLREILRQRRKELNLTQKRVADDLGISQTTISSLELGKRKMEDSKILPKILEYYKLDTKLIPKDKIIAIPSYYTEGICRLFGYIAGDGTKDNNRIILYDRDKENLEIYSKICEIEFGLKTKIRKCKKKNLYELRIYSKWLSDEIENKYPELIAKSNLRDIPNDIIKLPDNLLAAFISGLFDAEGFVTNRIGIGMRSRNIIEKLRYALLRFGIISSVYWKKTDQIGVWFLEINDLDSINIFKNRIGFSSISKDEKCNRITKKRADNIRQISVSGKEVIALARELGLNTRDFPNINMFFADKKRMSRKVFMEKVLPYFENAIKKEMKYKQNQDEKVYQHGIAILEYLKRTLEYEAVYPKIIRIEKIQNPNEYFYDLSVPETENFVVNGIIVHNSAARYQRFVEELVEDYYRRVGDAMNETLIPSGIKKVIVGGPGPVKENFLKMKPFNYQFQILAVLDTGYVDDYGIQELARKAVDLISEEKAKKQRQLLERFFGEVAKGGLAVYGPKETIEAMNSGKLGTLLLSEGLDITHLIVECDSGQEEIFIDGEIEEKEERELRCSNGSKIKNIISKEELFDEAYEKAEKHGIEVELIPEDSPEGKQFLAGFKGIGGLLRYK